jgi:L-ascorbate metabolism protein UlaG (beta-lactamase superfamily)
VFCSITPSRFTIPRASAPLVRSLFAVNLSLTHIGGPTVLIEVGDWRLLTDPTFDPAGGRYSFGWGTGSRKTAGPSILPDDLGAIDAVLLSHDQHDDNLDASGRAVLGSAGTVITTNAGAKRLGGQAIGLAPWEAITLEQEGRPGIEVTATPCRHGAPVVEKFSGPVIGFSLAWEGQSSGSLWISGDTVLYEGVRGVAERLDVGVALLHLGGVRFPATGPLRYTLTAEEAIELVGLVEPELAIPVHYEGWKHFRQGREQIEAALAAAPAGVSRRFRWIPIGEPVGIQA